MPSSTAAVCEDKRPDRARLMHVMQQTWTARQAHLVGVGTVLKTYAPSAPATTANAVINTRRG